MNRSKAANVCVSGKQRVGGFGQLFGKFQRKKKTHYIANGSCDLEDFDSEMTERPFLEVVLKNNSTQFFQYALYCRVLAMDSGNNTTNGTSPGDELKNNPVEEEMYSSWALLILTTLLIGALWTSYYLQLKKIRAIHETVISIMAGMYRICVYYYSIGGNLGYSCRVLLFSR